MFDSAPIRTAEGKFVCDILPHKNLSGSQQHLMREAPVSDLEPLDLIFLRCPSLLAEILGLSENRFQVIKSEQPSPAILSNFRILSR
jgi:hypothetical protein